MVRISLVVASIAVFTISAFGQAGQFDSAERAKAMLVHARTALTADKTAALETFNKGKGGFLDGDLYPFCVTARDGTVVATQIEESLGRDARSFRDISGRAFGQDVLAAAREGQLTEVTFMSPRPGVDKTPREKVAYVTAIGDLVCGVGYYK